MFLSIYLGMELLPHRPWGEVPGGSVAFRLPVYVDDVGTQLPQGRLR